jgi:methionine synthase I (cobalamin-dependent)/5,10-methylenetetrahydrofolate reductase
MPNSLSELFQTRSVLCDGAMGTMLYERGVFIHRCYDELNLSQPDLIRAIHEEYLQAGAEIIETNTFGGNRFRLQRHGLQDKVREINVAGVKIARQAADQIRDKQATQAYVAGAVGPIGVQIEPLGKVSFEEAQAAFAEQIHALAEGGADLLILETMTSLSEVHQAILAAREAAPELPILAMMTIDEEGNTLDGSSPEVAAKKLTDWGADAVGCNCSAGPATILSAIERMRTATTLPLVAMPNAGMPRAVDGRNIYLCSPEYMASFVRKFAQAGVQFVGGCCGTTPSHTRAMRSALRALDARKSGPVAAATVTVQNSVTAPPLEKRSKLGADLVAGKFIALVEIVPPRGISAHRELQAATMLAQNGVEAINVPDSPRASARMSALSLCLQIQQQVGIESVLHYTCRDRNVLSIQSDLLGAASLGLHNILCLTGDPPKLGNYPDATAVFDVDAIGLVNIVRNLNSGLDIGGNSIGASTGFAIGVAANPGVPDLDNEVRRFAYKVEAGAEYTITQPVFDLRLLEAFLKRVEQFHLPVIAGIWPLISLRNAEFMRNDLRVFVPDEILLRMQQADTPELARAEGVKIAQEMLVAARDMVQGVQVSAPSGRYEAALTVMESVLRDKSNRPTVESAGPGQTERVGQAAERGVNLGKL